tara:strand:+ start:138 stop:380 length:243 start_codon:yes stop_codon:yes gene_type:complete
MLEAIIREMQERTGRLVTFRELRSLVPAGKEKFDTAVITLARSGRISLDEHDFPGSLSIPALRVLVHHDGAYFVGASFRR